MARLFGLALVWLSILTLLPGVASGGENAGRSIVLPNGLKVFLYEKHDLPLVDLSIAVNAGSKDETAGTSGVAHLLEHCMLFRGTEFRSGSEVSRDIRSRGAYFNANTGPDLTLFEFSCPSEQAGFALRNQKEIVFDFALTPAELESEKAVILEEMSQREDDPERHGTDLLMQHLFEGHPYGRPLAGRAEVVRSVRVEDLATFHAKYFVPNNCALAMVGDFKTEDMEAEIREVFGTLKTSDVPAAVCPKAGLLGKNASFVEQKDVKEGYLLFGWIGPDYNHPDQYAVNLLAEVLGRGVNPLLNAALRSRWDLVQSMTMSYIPGRFGGAIVVSLKLEPKNIPAATREALNYLRRCHTENFSKDDYPGDERFAAFDYLGSAKNQIRFAAEQAEESRLVLASSLARFMLLNDREKPGRFLDRIARTTSGDLRKAAAVYFGRGGSVVVSIVPRRPEKSGEKK
jgi:zinc protease